MGGTYIRQNRPYNPGRPVIMLLIALISLSAWIVGFILSIGFPMAEESTATILWNIICKNIIDKRIAFGIGFVLMMSGAFLLHRMNYILALIREKTWLPFLIYIFLISTNLVFMPFRASSIGVFCLIISIYLLFTSYHIERSEKKAYNTALVLALGSLFWSHILWFIPVFWIGMYNFRAFKPRTFVASLLGLATVYWFVLGWCVWKNDFGLFTQLFSTITHFEFLALSDYGWIDLIPVFLVAIITIIASLNVLFYNYTDSIRSRQSLIFLVWLAAVTVVFMLIYNNSAEEFLQISCIPVSILTSRFFLVKRSRLTYGIFFFTLLVLTAYLFVRLWNF
jgi:hypothetical protein